MVEFSQDKSTKSSSHSFINSHGKIFSLSEPCVMGILNITDDSFFDGGKYRDIDKALSHVERMYIEGAKIIDVGACSTRPGAILIPKEEEKARLIPCVQEIRKRFPDLLISVDTVWSDVARASFDVGVDMINDISGGAFDDQMFATIGELRVPYVLMHTHGKPDEMQNHTQYANIFMEMCMYFVEKINQLRTFGAVDIIIDPGFGFAKTLEQNYELLRRLDEFHVLDMPLLVGVSRKSMLWKLLGCSPEEVLNGTSVLHTIALERGASILRVHDVKEAVETLTIVKQLNQK